MFRRFISCRSRGIRPAMKPRCRLLVAVTQSCKALRRMGRCVPLIKTASCLVTARRRTITRRRRESGEKLWSLDTCRAAGSWPGKGRIFSSRTTSNDIGFKPRLPTASLLAKNASNGALSFSPACVDPSHLNLPPGFLEGAKIPARQSLDGAIWRGLTTQSHEGGSWESPPSENEI
jgi:hypothetical protein